MRKLICLTLLASASVLLLAATQCVGASASGAPVQRSLSLAATGATVNAATQSIELGCESTPGSGICVLGFRFENVTSPTDPTRVISNGDTVSLYFITKHDAGTPLPDLPLTTYTVGTTEPTLSSHGQITLITPGRNAVFDGGDVEYKILLPVADAHRIFAKIRTASGKELLAMGVVIY